MKWPTSRCGSMKWPTSYFSISGGVDIAGHGSSVSVCVAAEWIWGAEWLYERAAEWIWVAEWIWAAKWLYERTAEWI